MGKPLQEVVDEWVKKIAQTTMTHLDWGYRAGRAIVYHVGDGRQQALDELRKPHPGIQNVTILVEIAGGSLQGKDS
jgi:hypothetical protein